MGKVTIGASGFIVAAGLTAAAVWRSVAHAAAEDPPCQKQPAPGNAVQPFG
jgi:hypothetical protein